jgi:uncharacterized membrane protein
VTNSWWVLLVVGIQLLLSTGDVLAKQGRSVAAVAVWWSACVLCLPALKPAGFTRLIAMSDAIGLIVVAAFGWAFLHERLTGRELLGCALALAAILVMREPGK